MFERNVQMLSADDTIRLMKSLSCYKGYLSAGNENCTATRHKAGVTPEDVGHGEDTLADPSQRFAIICETCPVLLTSFKNIFPD